jgi:phosphatidylserine/phosphatidylglycerophosphate/cardiolipin synthase-like enzyme
MAISHHKELGVVGSWWQTMMKNASANKAADPNYFATQPELLQTEARLGSFIVGSGEDIYNHICPAIELAQEELILVTCFWAKSSSLDNLCASLRALSKRVTENQEARIRVFIGFSSVSALQKLFHTRSTQGRIYPPTEWTKKLWLPDPAELPGLDIQIKSIFVVPFSIIHTKFVIIDRKLVFLPSCNVSWESWFEGCITLSGPIIEQFIRFWEKFWLRSDAMMDEANGSTDVVENNASIPQLATYAQPGAAYSTVSLKHLSSCYTVFLPSPHHRNPRFSLPWQQCRPPPSTPLNGFLTELIESATSSIYMQTPNVTSPPVLKMLLQALRRGVNVHVLTSERLMILEQVVTAGTTTSRCVKKLVKLYKRSASSPYLPDLESDQVPIGSLKIEYYQPRPEHERLGGEPAQSHLKLTIVDEEWTILGSGNMDRASWYTSQELGVAFNSKQLAKEVKQAVAAQMFGRSKLAFDSSASEG